MPDIEEILESRLAPYAMSTSLSRGRLHPDHETPHRGLFQRDRDRIVHSSAFRRLQYKTQVFVSVMEGDYYRNRLTHTIEVTQIARTIARALGLNEDLTEALALGHDLGHGPFGHSGESALDEVMQGKGGFDHNAQGLRIVDSLEIRYPRFRGLNLTYETREGYVKNYVTSAPIENGGTREDTFSGQGTPPLPPPIQGGEHGNGMTSMQHVLSADQSIQASEGSKQKRRPRASLGFASDECSSLEVQLVGHADEIAYNTHDLDDGLVSGALREEQVRGVELWRDVETQILAEHAVFKTDHRLRWRAVVRRLIATLVNDMLVETQQRLAQNKIQSVNDARHARMDLVAFSSAMTPRKRELETFLMAHFYQSPQVSEKTALWQERLKNLFLVYQADPKRLPTEYLKRIDTEGETPERVICDYVAGMTDRYASKQWECLVR